MSDSEVHVGACSDSEVHVGACSNSEVHVGACSCFGNLKYYFMRIFVDCTGKTTSY